MQLSLIEKTTIGQCATIISGVLPQEKKNVKLLSFRAVLPGQLTAAEMSGEFGTVLRDTPCAPEQYLQPGDVLIKRLNPDCAVVFSQPVDQIVASANLFIIRPKPVLDSHFLAFLLENSKLLKRITQLSGVGTTVAAVTSQKIAECEIPLPSLEEQIKIGQFGVLAKRKMLLLREMIAENDRLQQALCGKLYQFN